MTSPNSNIISVITLRRTIGILGMSLPVTVAVGAVIFGNCNGILKSVSVYYDTIMRNVFVGILFAFALLMSAYKGYDYKDRIAGLAVSVFAVATAVFPASADYTVNCIYKIEELKRPSFVRTIHLSSAALLFIVLSYFSLFLFTRTDKNKTFTKQKKKRNTVYVVCGIVMLSAIILIIAWMLKLSEIFPGLEKYHLVFWLETIGLFAFGISWLVKGEAALKDKQ